MSNYHSRLDRVEAAIAPKDELIVLIVRDGQTNEGALAAYANDKLPHGDAVHLHGAVIGSRYSTL